MGKGSESNLNKSKKLYNVEAVRFLFAVIIVYYHILHSNIMNFTGNSAFYEKLALQSNNASLIVECFFIISGYFLYKSYCRRPDLSVKEFIYNKVARLWPMLLVYELIILIFFSGKPYVSFFNVLFLQCNGISFDYQGINWYISPLFWCLIFYFVLLKCTKDKRKTNLFIAVLVYFSYVMNLRATNGDFGRDVEYGFISLAMFRAIAGVGLGYLIGTGLNSVKNLPSVKNFKPGKMERAVISVVISVFEIGSFALLLVQLLYKDKAYQNKFIAVILFSCLFICMLTGKGILSRITNNRLLGFFGKYAYSIYVMQQISFYIMQKTLWQNTAFVQQHALRCIAVSIVITVLFGIAAYYIIEKPAAALFRKFGKKLFKK